MRTYKEIVKNYILISLKRQIALLNAKFLIEQTALYKFNKLSPTALTT